MMRHLTILGVVGTLSLLGITAPVHGGGGKTPVETAKGIIDPAKKAQQDYARIRDDLAKGTQADFLSILKSASDIDPQRITPAFIATAGRGKVKLSKAEVELLAVLDSPLNVEFDKTRLKEAIELLQDKGKGKLKLFFDEASLKEAGVEYDDPVTFKAKNVTFRTVLKKVLADRGLTYIIKEGAVQVITPAKARETHVTRVYSLDGLLAPGNPSFGQFANRVQMYQQMAGFVQLITETVDPGSWLVNGGNASITFYEAGRALIIKGPAEMHYQFGNSFSR